jgi:hypothetical protein
MPQLQSLFSISPLSQIYRSSPTRENPRICPRILPRIVLPLLPHPAIYKTLTLELRAVLIGGLSRGFKVNCLSQLDVVLPSSAITLFDSRHSPLKTISWLLRLSTCALVLNMPLRRICMPRSPSVYSRPERWLLQSRSRLSPSYPSDKYEIPSLEYVLYRQAASCASRHHLALNCPVLIAALHERPVE